MELAGKKNVELSVDLVRHMIINTLRSYTKKHKAKYGEMVIAIDGGNYWRREYFPHYKAHRKAARDASGLDWTVIFKTMKEVKADLIEYFPYKVVDVEGAEADDVIAVICEWSQENYLQETALFDPEPKPILIISGDGDFVQLQKWPNIEQYSPLHKKFVKADKAIDYIVLEHIIRGDKGDGVPNVLSADDCLVNKVRQKSLYDSVVKEWLAQPETMPQTDEFKRNFSRNQTLVDLSKIPTNIKNKIIESFESKPACNDRSRLIEYFMKHKMKHLLDTIQDF